MLNDYVAELANDLNQKKDKWFLETLHKHGLLDDPERKLTDLELYMIANDEQVRIEHKEDNKRTQIYIKDSLVGEWFDTYEFVKEENKYTCKTKFWN